MTTSEDARRPPTEPDRAPPTSPPIVATAVEKASALAECLSSSAGTAITMGWERGNSARVMSGAWVAQGPSAVEVLDATPHDGLADWAERLRRQLAAAVPLPDAEVAVLVSNGVIREQPSGMPGAAGWLRHVSFAGLMLGGVSDSPRWRRTVLITSNGAPLPEAALKAAAREVTGWNPDLPEETLGDRDRAVRTVVLDAFATADLLRAAAAGWIARGTRLGTAVASPVVELDDPGFFFHAEQRDRDAEGTPVRPLAVVRGGRLIARPRTRSEENLGLGRSTGSSVRTSWRTPARADWRSLVVRMVSHSDSWPEDAFVMTRLALVADRLLGAGFVLRDGAPSARWGPAPLPGPGWWLSRLERFIGQPVMDGGGFPIQTAAALARLD